MFSRAWFSPKRFIGWDISSRERTTSAGQNFRTSVSVSYKFVKHFSSNPFALTSKRSPGPSILCWQCDQFNRWTYFWEVKTHAGKLLHKFLWFIIMLDFSSAFLGSSCLHYIYVMSTLETFGYNLRGSFGS